MSPTPLTVPAPLALAGSVATAVPFAMGSTTYVTLIAKATFVWVPENDMVRTTPQPILRNEVHYGENPGRTVRFGTDLALYMRRVDVLFTGSAYSTRKPTRNLPVRLAIYRGAHGVLDKHLVAQSDTEFVEMPLVYENASEGVDGEENPFGMPKGALPLVVDPRFPDRPAGFGPIPRAYPRRMRLLGTTPRMTLEGPHASVPQGFDWSYFQAAPSDQQVDAICGDEWLVLEGLHSKLSVLRTRLPEIRGEGRIYGLSADGIPEGDPLALPCDTIRIDGASQTCTVLCRKVLPLPNEGALPALRVALAVLTGADDVEFPVSMNGVTVESWTGPRFGQPPVSPPSSSDLDSAPSSDSLSTAQTACLSTQAPQETLCLSGEAPPPLSPFPFRSVNEGPTATLVAPGEEAVTAAVLPPGWVPSSPSNNPAPNEAPTALPGAPWSPKSAGFVPVVQPGAETLLLWNNEDPPKLTTPSPPLPDQVQVQVLEEPTTASRPVLAAPSPSPEPDMQDARASSRAAPQSSKPLADPSAGAEEGYLELGTMAAIAVALSTSHSSRSEILLHHGLTEARWSVADKGLSEALHTETKAALHTLRDRYDDAYLVAWEVARGPFGVLDYARLSLATHRGRLSPTLEAMGIRRSSWLHIRRAFARRMGRDQRLALGVEQARTVLVREGA